MKTHYQILIVGGGNAGISIAAQLIKRRKDLDIAIIDPADKHYYQPAWTLVGGGSINIENTVRDLGTVIPDGVKWIKESAIGFEPGENILRASGGNYSYDFLIVCPGIQMDWHKIRGLAASLGKNGVTTNYKFELAPYTYECFKHYRGGKALFTMPDTPVKSGGASQKIMFMVAENFRKREMLKKGHVRFYASGAAVTGAHEFAETLKDSVNRYGIETFFSHDLIEVNAEKKQAVFEYKFGDIIQQKAVQFEMIHVTPPQSAPDFIKNSPLAMKDNPFGWVDVNIETFQHMRYNNIFGIGDAASTPNSKTGGAIRKQVPVLVQNLLALVENKNVNTIAVFHGYETSSGIKENLHHALAQPDYQNSSKKSFPLHKTKERWTAGILKKYILPWIYWNKVLKGSS